MENLRNFLGLESPDSSIDLNEMLAYEIIGDDEVWIHIDDVRELSLSEKTKLFIDGLRKLADLLQHEPKLAQIKKVSGMSWIIAKNPKIVKSLGFNILDSLEGLEDQVAEYKKRKDYLEIHQDDPPGYAYINREKLILLYGQPNTPSVVENAN